jgi:transcription elongation factor Elf1
VAERYLIVSCPKCGSLRIVRRQRTFSCFACGVNAEVAADRIVASADTAREARRILAALKMRGALSTA